MILAFLTKYFSGKKFEYSQKYKTKYSKFLQNINTLKSKSNKLELKVRRKAIIEDSFNLIGNMNKAQVNKLKNNLWIIFDGEQGLDYGGLSREWFYILSKEIFNPKYGLFYYSSTNTYNLQINPNSGLCHVDHLDYFKFIGRIVGMAIFHKMLVSGFFIRPFYTMMLGKPITLEDMEFVDADYFKSLVWIRDNDPEILCLTFQVDDEVFGEQVTKELIKGGGDIQVTERNKTEYIDKMTEWRFISRIKNQMSSFMEGFYDVIPKGSIDCFDEKELELLLGGIESIDVKDWRKNTEYKNYLPNNRIIIWFWRLVLSFCDEKRSRLLQFVTGTSRVPMNGFAVSIGCPK